MNLFEVYEDRAVERGGAPAISYPDGPVHSWDDLVTRAGGIAADLRRRGLRPGGRCAVVMADRPDVVPALLAVWSCEALAVVLDPLWGEPVRESVLRHSGAELLVVVGDGELAVTDLRGGRLHRPDAPPLSSTAAVLAYTSGSTGAPKGIAVHHDRVISGMIGAGAVLDAYRGEPSVRFGTSMRLSGFGVLALHYLWSAVRGSEVVVLPRLDLTTAGRYWADLERHGVDLSVLVSPLVELLLRASRSRPGAVPPLFVNSSGPITERATTRFHDQFGASVLNCYGLTECSFAITMGDTSEPGRTTISVGRPYQVRVRLRGADGVVAGAGEGELEFWGPLMSDGYYDDPEATAAVMDGPWMRSGDRARRGADGRYWIVGRVKDAVMKGGQTVYLTEVDEACLAVPGVVEAISVRLDIGGGGEDIGVLARTGPDGPDESGLRRELDRRLGRERGPRRVVLVVEPLPRIGQHKPDRRAARTLWDERVRR